MEESAGMSDFFAECVKAFRTNTSKSKRDDLRRRYFTVYAANNESSFQEYAGICAALLVEEQSELEESELIQRYRFLIWISGVFFKVDDGADELHELGVYFVSKGHARFSYMLFRKEWLLRRRKKEDANELIEVYLQLAVTADEIGFKSRVGALLYASAKYVDEIGGSGKSADLALRLCAYWVSVKGDSLSALKLLDKAEGVGGLVDIYDASETQVFLGWVSAICSLAFQPHSAPRPTLLAIILRSFTDISEKADVGGRFVEFDMLLHALDRSGYGHLGVLSMAAAIRIAQDTDHQGLSREDQLILKNNFGNVLLTGEWNSSARAVFESTISSVPVEWLAEPEMLFQLGHAYAGVGYSYYNEGRALSGLEAQRGYEAAAKAFESAVLSIEASNRTTFHEARIWVCSGVTNFKLGEVNKGHADFVKAFFLGGGEKSFELVWESMIGVDYDTPLKYSEALSVIGADYASAFFAKLSLMCIYRSAMPEVSLEGASRFVVSRSFVHRALIEVLSALGRFNEAEYVFDLLQASIYEGGLVNRSDILGLVEMSSIMSVEREVLSDLALSIPKQSLNFSVRKRSFHDYVAAFSRMDSMLRAKFTSRPSESSYVDLVRRLGFSMSKDAALIRYVVAEEKLLLSIVYDGGYHNLSFSVRGDALNSLVFSLRRHCRAYPYASAEQVREVSGRLFNILIAPIVNELGCLPSILYLELDSSIQAVPFSMLFDGEQHLCQRTTVVNLLRTYNSDSRPVASEVEKWSGTAAVLSSAGEQDESLPGAYQEAMVVSELLATRPNLSVKLFVGEECTVQSLLGAISNFGETSTLIHVASHATFNATNEEHSAFILSDGFLNLRELREYLGHCKAVPTMVVLSACGTARSDLEVEGFATIFLRNGVQATISTLWESLDVSAPDFFENFYSYDFNPASALSVSFAVRHAMCSLIEQKNKNFPDWYAHPANWGPYVVTATDFN